MRAETGCVLCCARAEGPLSCAAVVCLADLATEVKCVCARWWSWCVCVCSPSPGHGFVPTQCWQMAVGLAPWTCGGPGARCVHSWRQTISIISASTGGHYGNCPSTWSSTHRVPVSRWSSPPWQGWARTCQFALRRVHMMWWMFCIVSHPAGWQQRQVSCAAGRWFASWGTGTSCLPFVADCLLARFKGLEICRS